MNSTLLLWIVLLPLLGSLGNGFSLLLGLRLSRTTAGILATTASIGAFILSVLAFLLLSSMTDPLRQLHCHLFTWISSGSFHVNLALVLDPLSAVMILIITGVGSLIHIYSMGYMHEDHSYQRYFSYLNLFLFAMLVLVLGDNLLVLFIGWEGVGLASYLLIGFWFKDAEKAKAGMKAFVVNRIGDLGFLVGIFVLFWALYPHLQAGESFSFATINKYIDILKETRMLGVSSLEIAGLSLFIGAMGKSAQIPLYVWLPDAMAGPTPVSALIHAATMVTAGIYMIARMNLLYSAAPITSTWIAGVGAVTALFAAIIGLFQNDIKKVLAYSTVSQLGFMFVGVGVGAYTAGVFHLMTHAFFKALLFLGAGSVIVGLHHEQDIRKMGGLFRTMGITGFTFLVGTLAIIGFPGFSGFFSKDEILWKAFATQHTVVWALCFAAAILTALYMTRLFCLVFLGESRTDSSSPGHGHTDSMPHPVSHPPSPVPQIHGGATPQKHPQVAHESPPNMTVPLMILALLSALGGLLGIPYFLTRQHPILEHWLAPVFAKGWLHYHPQGAELMGHVHQHPHLWWGEGTSMSLTIVGMMVGVGVALYFYAGQQRAKRSMATELAWQQPGSGGWMGQFYRLVYNKFYVDEIYEATLVRPIHHLSRDGLWPFDQVVVDGVVNLCATITQGIGRLLSWVQTGQVRWYLTAMMLGLFSLLLWLILHHASS